MEYTRGTYQYCKRAQPKGNTNKWKNHFYEMNGDVGMAGYKV